MRIAKTPITNRRGQTMYVRYDRPQCDIKGLAIIQHGFAGSMDQPHIKAIAQTFREKGFATLSLDCTHAFNAADGDPEGCRMHTHLHDLYDAIDWAKTQDFYREPFAVSGQSLGGFTVMNYAAEYPGKVSLLFPCSCVTNGKKLAEAFERNLPEGVFQSWVKQGYQEIESWDGSGKRARRSYEWLADMDTYDIYEKVDRLTMPILLTVGSNDIPTPPDHHLMLYNVLPEDTREMHIIPGADHGYTQPEHLAKMTEILGKWIEKNA